MANCFDSRVRSWQIQTSVLLAVIGLAVSSGCRPDNSPNGQAGPPEQHDHQPAVIAVVYPLQFLTQQICGNAISVTCAVPPNVDPETWKPTREDILKMQAAELIVANGNGARYAQWLETISIPDSRLCLSATRGLALTDYITVEDLRLVHSHGPEGEHSHASTVAETWLDPAMASKQAAYIAKTLSKVFPDQSPTFAANLTALQSRLDELSAKLAPGEGAPVTVITANPRLKFLTRAAGINDKHLTWFGPPTMDQATKDLAALRPTSDTDAAPDSGAPDSGATLFLSTFPVSAQLTELLQKQGLDVVVLDPIVRESNTGDYLDALSQNIERLNSALGRSK